MSNNPHDIVPAHLAVQAMRDNGYKNAAYAIAELMDNSIQAGATEVELLCAETVSMVEQRRSSRIYKIAVLDNGSGMDATVLRLALQFGNGTYLEKSKHTGIGRFGMGLPSSSVSQCQKVEVWSWQNGIEKALYTYLDLEEIKQQHQTEVPEPIAKSIPQKWFKAGNIFGKTGTLVVWSNIDKCIWKKGTAIIDNSEFLIGRIYRKFLENGKVNIRMKVFDYDTNDVTEYKNALPNDPGYLMKKTSCPPPFDKTPMFEAWEADGEGAELPINVDFRGETHTVILRFSHAKEEARQAEGGKNPGSLPHGKHAFNNLGISVVRAGRELELDETLVNHYNPTERWWGVEIEFPPALDDLFGVTNNKQSARNFQEVLNVDVESLLKDNKTIIQLKKEFKEEEDPRGPLLEVALRIRNQLASIRRILHAQTQGTRSASTKRYPSPKVEEVATVVTQERKKQGHQGASDIQESLPKQERKEIIEKALVNEGFTKNYATELAATTVDSNFKYIFEEADTDTPAFFTVKSKGGAIIVLLNTRHPAYDNLMEILKQDVDDVDAETLRSRLSNSLKGLQLLLGAWARYEDEQPEGKRRQDAAEIRANWGSMARLFLEKDD